MDRPTHPLASPRVVYAAGPGDVIGTYRHWIAGRDDPAQVAVTYSSQFYDLCREAGASGYLIASTPSKQKLVDGQFIIEHRPVPFSRGPGPMYHVGQTISAVRLIASAVRFKADLVVVTQTSHWFVLGLLPLFGIAVVPTLHCVLWAKSHPPTGRLNRLIWKWNRRFFRKRVLAVLSLSNDITSQVESMLDGTSLRIIPFLPSYRRESFGDGFGPPPLPPPFRVFFAGRIEKNKGVFDLFNIARRFADEGHTEIEFDLCGTGGQLETLKQEVERAGLQNRFRLHGHSTKPFMRQMYEQCHVVIVPTTSDFNEGFNKVVAEGVLAGRPVITSSVCPALEYVRQAVLKVPPDQPAATGDAILSLSSNPTLYEQKREGSSEVRKQFYDPTRSWRAAFLTALSLVRA